MKRRQTALLLGQKALLQQLTDDAFDRLRQTPLAFPAAGLAGSQVRHKASALPGTVDQDIYLSPGQAQRLSGGVDGLMPHHLKRCQWSDDVRSLPGLGPGFIGQGGHALLGNRC